uniref:Putative lipocalin n=1 Tax=Rhipicephalus microplus TaxID=6941 RepID=A0A6G5A2H7_RHIMP
MKAGVLLAIFVLITTRITIHTSCVDIKQFVNTSQKIWTVRTTNRAFIKCEADQMKSIRPLSIDFVRSSSIMRTSRNLRILGVFDSQHKKRMTLFLQRERRLLRSASHKFFYKPKTSPKLSKFFQSHYRNGASFSCLQFSMSADNQSREISMTLLIGW